MPRSSSSARPTATPTSTRPTSASCSTSSSTRSPSRRRSSASSRRASTVADTAVPAPAADHTRMQRVLDGIERLGNKMPDPAILFLWLCLGVILLSQALAWLDVKATYEVVSPPPAPATETYYGGSVYPTYVGPATPEPATDYKLHEETTRVKGLLSVDGVTALFVAWYLIGIPLGPGSPVHT